MVIITKATPIVIGEKVTKTVAKGIRSPLFGLESRDDPAAMNQSPHSPLTRLRAAGVCGADPAGAGTAA
jgi:hypothetical protein